MLQKKRTKNYPFQQSILYNLKSKNKLAKLLNISLKDLKVIQGDEHYSCFVVSGGRSIQHPLDDLYKVHKFINKLLSRIELPDYLHSGRKKRSSITNAQSHLFSQYTRLPS